MTVFSICLSYLSHVQGPSSTSRSGPCMFQTTCRPSGTSRSFAALGSPVPLLCVLLLLLSSPTLSLETTYSFFSTRVQVTPSPGSPPWRLPPRLGAGALLHTAQQPTGTASQHVTPGLEWSPALCTADTPPFVGHQLTSATK